MPSTKKVQKILIDSIPEDFSGKILDFGSGWGSLVFPLAKRFSQCQVIGYELSPIPYFVSRLLQIFFRYPNLNIYYRNYLKQPLPSNCIVCCYLFPQAMRDLKKKLEDELSLGSLVLSNTFSIPSWKAHSIFTISDIYRTRVYLYQFSKDLHPD